ncbi:MAG: AAA family ATPase [Actinomycetota bacterium]
MEVLAESPLQRLRFPLVGRDDELQSLLRALEGVVTERSCRLVTVIGPAGQGKSRIVAEVVRALDDRATTLRGRCLPYGESITFWPVLEVVKQAAAAALFRFNLGPQDCTMVYVGAGAPRCTMCVPLDCCPPPQPCTDSRTRSGCCPMAEPSWRPLDRQVVRRPRGPAVDLRPVRPGRVVRAGRLRGPELADPYRANRVVPLGRTGRKADITRRRSVHG